MIFGGRRGLLVSVADVRALRIWRLEDRVGCGSRSLSFGNEIADFFLFGDISGLYRTGGMEAELG